MFELRANTENKINENQISLLASENTAEQERLLVSKPDSLSNIVVSNSCPSPTFLNSLPNDKISDWSKLKALTDDKIDATEKSKFVLGRVKNIVGKRRNAGYQYFLLFPQCFPKPSSLDSLKVGIEW